MCPPFAHDVGVANNIWMTDYKEGERHLNRGRSYTQFLDLYNYLASEGIVYLLPAPANSGLQDQVFVANLAFKGKALADYRLNRVGFLWQQVERNLLPHRPP